MTKELKIVDDRLASYLKFSPDEARKFVYYTFETNQTEHWDILGIRYLDKSPLLLDVRLMYIDQDARDWEGFIAERDAPGYITCDPTKYLTIITFFEALLDVKVHNQDTTNYFSLLDHDKLQKLHHSTTTPHAIDTYYRYTSSIERQDSNMINLVCFPHWSSQYGMHQISALWFISLSQQHLNNAQFDLESDIEGLGTLRFNQSSLEEFVFLLNKHKARFT